jgi:uncharacterized protein YndB with AHSA1/START domain
MSCTESDVPSDAPAVTVERTVEIPAAPDAVWDELAGMLGDEVELTPEPGGALRVHDADGDRVGVVLEAEPGARLSFRWATVDGDDAPSEVEIGLQSTGLGTIVHIRETRLDGAHLARSAFRAFAVLEVRGA